MTWSFSKSCRARHGGFLKPFLAPKITGFRPTIIRITPWAVIAHRTSPTNMGLALLSNLAAYDFGFISVAQLEERTAKAFTTMERLERFRGHFFNWYDTSTLGPLPPRYVSTVDSGNLVGHLLTLREGLLQLADQNILPPAALRGLGITLRSLAHSRTTPPERPNASDRRAARRWRVAIVAAAWNNFSRNFCIHRPLSTPVLACSRAWLATNTGDRRINGASGRASPLVGKRLDTASPGLA